MGFTQFWKMLGPPLTPGPEELSAVEEMLPSLQGKTVFVLGATRALVELAIDHGAARVFAGDINDAIFDVVRGLSSRDWSNVIPIADDWLNLRPELCGAVDVALGDNSFCLLSLPDEWRRVLSNLRRYLEPSGHGVFRSMFHPSASIDVDAVLARAIEGFDERMAGASTDDRIEAFCGVASTIRLLSIVGSLGPDGEADHGLRRALMEAYRAELAARYGGDDVRPVIEAVFGTAQEARDGRMMARTLPQWDDARSFLEECGFAVFGEKRSGSRPARDVFVTFGIRPA